MQVLGATHLSSNVRVGGYRANLVVLDYITSVSIFILVKLEEETLVSQQFWQHLQVLDQDHNMQQTSHIHWLDNATTSIGS